MKTSKNTFELLFPLLAAASLILSSCSPKQTATSTSTPTSLPPVDTIIPTIPALTVTPTSIPFPILNLKPGDFYFSLDGKPAFLFSRNLAGITPKDYAVLVGMAHQQGDLLVRIVTDNESMGGFYGYGYTNNGEIQADWSSHWRNLIETAESNGIYVIPTFTGWANWNKTGYNTWSHNPFNSDNGGPAKDPREIFKKDSPTQLLYLQWFKKIVTRWQVHKNILAWEVVTEVNFINGISQEDGVYLTEQLANVAREADPLHRPVTASLADVGEWPDFYRSKAVDFINFHPYPPSAKLDTYVLHEVRRYITTYNKPVLIGESGLNADTPDSLNGKITVAKNARLGIQHAIWAETVSGAMNGRALFWEDGFGIYFNELGMPFLQKYTDVEAPAVQFMNGVDMTGFKPVAAQLSDKILGAALGNENLIIGWFRDAFCEPPNWNLQQLISKQTVTITVPGTSDNWKIDFYDTKTGTDIVSSLMVTRKGDKVTITLPDFTDDIAFKMTAQEGSSSVPVAETTTDTIAGKWSGTITGTSGSFSTLLNLDIQPDCKPGQVCGTFSVPMLPCSGQLFFQEVTGESFLFIEKNSTGSAFCTSGGYEYLQPLADGTLSYSFSFTPDTSETTNGILQRP